MYYDNYDENMRNMYRYPNEDSYVANHYYNMPAYHNQYMRGAELESMYPMSYKVIYPMICEVCDRAQMPVTEEMLCKMRDDIIHRIEIEGTFNIQIEREKGEENEETVALSRRRNPFVNDLVQILLIRELLHRRPNHPNKPPFPVRPFWWM